MDQIYKKLEINLHTLSISVTLQFLLNVFNIYYIVLMDNTDGKLFLSTIIYKQPDQCLIIISFLFVLLILLFSSIPGLIINKKKILKKKEWLIKNITTGKIRNNTKPNELITLIQSTDQWQCVCVYVCIFINMATRYSSIFHIMFN